MPLQRSWPRTEKPLDAVVLKGFLGRSAQDGNVRLYDDVGFQSYYEISASDIIHSQEMPATQAPLGGSVVYVRRSGHVRRVQISAEIEARFLQGPMAAAATSAASSGLGVSQALLARQRHMSIDRCPSDDHTSCADVCPDAGTGARVALAVLVTPVTVSQYIA